MLLIDCRYDMVNRLQYNKRKKKKILGDKHYKSMTIHHICTWVKTSVHNCNILVVRHICRRSQIYRLGFYDSARNESKPNVHYKNRKISYKILYLFKIGKIQKLNINCTIHKNHAKILKPYFFCIIRLSRSSISSVQISQLKKIQV